MDSSEHLVFLDPQERPAQPRYSIIGQVLGDWRLATHEKYAHVRLSLEPWRGAHALAVVWLLEDPGDDEQQGIHRAYFPAICRGIRHAAL